MKKLFSLLVSVVLILGMVSAASVLDSCESLTSEVECEDHPNCQWAAPGQTGIFDCYVESAVCEDYLNEDDCLLDEADLTSDYDDIDVYDSGGDVAAKEPCVWEGDACYIDCSEQYGTNDEACEGDNRCEWDATEEVCQTRFTQVRATTETMAGQVLEVVEMVLGGVDRIEAARQGIDVPESPLEVLLFVYVLPILFLYMILADMFYLMGMFRPMTAKVLAIIVALFAARAQVYLNIIAMIGGVFNNFFVGSLSLLFTMMIVWWLINHFLIGYTHAKVIHKTEDAMTYLEKVGTHLNKLQKED